MIIDNTYSRLVVGALWQLVEDLRSGKYEAEQADVVTKHIIKAFDVLEAEEIEKFLIHAISVLPKQSITDIFMFLADDGFTLRGTVLLSSIAGFLGDEDEALVQATTACLLICGGITGNSIITQIVSSSAEVPHKALIADTLKFYDKYGE